MGVGEVIFVFTEERVKKPLPKNFSLTVMKEWLFCAKLTSCLLLVLTYKVPKEICPRIPFSIQILIGKSFSSAQKVCDF